MYLTLQELSKELNLHQNTLRKHIKNGMPHLRAGRDYRFKLDEVVEWFKEGGGDIDK